MQVSSSPSGPRSAALRIGAFFVLLAVALTGVDLLVDAGLRRIRTSSFGAFNRITEGGIDADIVISGSSRALNHFDPRVIHERTGRSAINIGVNGSQTDMQVAVFRTYLAHNRAPMLLVQNLDSFSFVTSHDGLYFPAQYVPYLREPALYDTLVGIDPDLWKLRYLPLYGYTVQDMGFTWWLGLRGLAGWNPPEDRYLGFEPRHASWTGEFDQFRGTRARGVTFGVDPRGVKDFEALMDLCRDRHIPVLLVYSPVYREMQALETNRAEIFERFRAIAKRYDATLWDYSDDPLSGRRDAFVNSQHLNATGAALFSDRFGTDLARSPLAAASLRAARDPR